MSGVAMPLRAPIADRSQASDFVAGLPRRGPTASQEGPTPLRRRFSVKRRNRSGIPALLAGAALRALLVVALPVGIVVWLLYSPYFRIAEVKVEGGTRVSAAWMEQNLAPLVGRHVLAVSLDGVRRRLSDHPWVASVELRRELPDRLRVSVVERKPVALVARKDGLWFLDRAGEVIAPAVDAALPDGRAQGPPLRPERRSGQQTRQGVPSGSGVGAGPDPARPDSGPAATRLLVIRYADDGPVPVQPALDLVAELRRAHPAWGRAVEQIEVLGEGEYRVRTAALAYPLLLAAGHVEPAVHNLQRVLPDILRRVSAVGEADLRSPRRLVIRPAASPHRQEG